MRPLFIVGCPRSGTTLLAAMLGAGPGCVAVPESQFLPECRGALDRGEIDDNARSVFSWIQRHPRFRLWGLDPDPAVLPSEGGPAALTRVMEWLAGQWAGSVDRADAVVWIDHTPTHVRWGDTLLDLFPEARLVHLVRDGRAVAASLRPLDWGPGEPVAAARWWESRVAPGLALETSRPDRVARARFEDLVADPEPALRRVCDHAGLDYDPAMLAADGYRPARYSRKQHRLVGRPPDAARADAWRTALGAREIEIFESTSGDLLRSLGYEPLHGSGARPPRRAERLRFAASETLRRRLVNPIRRRLRRWGSQRLPR
ncbi:MAG: sulfotransferase [bacterium]|nr:sulfotransferase [bacterium]